MDEKDYSIKNKFDILNVEKCSICSDKAVKKLIFEYENGQIYVCADIGCNDKIKRDINNCFGYNSIKYNKKIKKNLQKLCYTRRCLSWFRILFYK